MAAIKKTVGRQMFELWLTASETDLSEYENYKEIAGVVRGTGPSPQPTAVEAEPVRRRPGRPVGSRTTRVTPPSEPVQETLPPVEDNAPITAPPAFA